MEQPTTYFEGARIPQLLKPLLTQSTAKNCVSMQEPLPLHYCPKFKYNTDILCYEVVSLNEKDKLAVIATTAVSESHFAKGMHLNLNVTVKVSQRTDYRSPRGGDLPSNLLFVFEIPAGAYVDLNHLMVYSFRIPIKLPR